SMNLGDAFLFLGSQCRDISMFSVKIVQPTCRIGRPGCQCLLHNGITRCLISFFKIKRPQSFCVCICYSSDPMIRVHTSRVPINFGKSWQPKIIHLLSHPYEGIDNIRLDLFVYQHTQWMCSAIGIPDPVIGIEVLLILVNFAVESTKVTTIFS